MRFCSRKDFSASFSLCGEAFLNLPGPPNAFACEVASIFVDPWAHSFILAGSIPVPRERASSAPETYLWPHFHCLLEGSASQVRSNPPPIYGKMMGQEGFRGLPFWSGLFKSLAFDLIPKRAGSRQKHHVLNQRQSCPTFICFLSLLAQAPFT